MSVITYNPLYVVFSEEYSDASYDQREILVKSKCREGENTIEALSKIFPGDIRNMEIPALNLSVPCILHTYKTLDENERSYVLSVSPHLQVD